jgi:xanthine dehydrogenase molybdenum-binding subunit
MATCIHVSGCRGLYSEHSTAIVKVNEDGAVFVHTGVADLGNGNRTVMAQIAAEVLGVPYEAVYIVGGMVVDTDISPLDVGTYGSRATYVAGGAVKRAAEDARRQILELAGDNLEISVDDLVLRDGRVFVAGAPEKSTSMADLVMEANWAWEGSRDIVGVCHHEPSQAPIYAASFIEVEVDTESGEARLLKVVSAHDVGRAVNPAHCRGQIFGAASQGLGYATTEHLAIDRKTGYPLNASMLDYRILSMNDMPEVIPILVETDEPTGPFGAKGLGELAMVPTAAAFSNAIYNAVGVRLRELPITPDKILQALSAVRKGD